MTGSSGRPRRSVLYMPGSNERALEKAKSLAADALILDLEDAVAPDAKESARRMVCDAARSGVYGAREVVIRVNGLDTPWGAADLAAAATSGAGAVLLPKVESADAVRAASRLLDANGAPADMAIWCMIETPFGVLDARAIASAGGRLACFVMGTSDLAKDLHCLHTPDRMPFLTALSLAILAARGYGLAVLDGVYLDLGDEAGFEAACVQGLELGFDGKTLIHPKQIEAANRIFAPAPGTVEWSRKVIAAHEAAKAEGAGVTLVDGRLVEVLHVREAERILALSQAISALEKAGD